MASRFSGALQITNLDDFITPSQVYDNFDIISISMIKSYSEFQSYFKLKLYYKIVLKLYCIVTGMY